MVVTLLIIDTGDNKRMLAIFEEDLLEIWLTITVFVDDQDLGNGLPG